MRLRLPPKGFDRGFDLALLRHHGQNFGDRLPSLGRADAVEVADRRRWIASTLLSRQRLVSSCPMIAPAPATPAATTAAAATPSAVPRSKAAEIQPIASTVNQPAKKIARPASPSGTTRLRRRGGSRTAMGAAKGTVGVTRSVRSLR
jgi:hypothetical protein